VAAGECLASPDYVSACQPTCVVVLASPGYPEKVQTGGHILGLEDWVQSGDYQCFFAGVARTKTGLQTAGGRVLGVGAQASSVPEAVKKAYEAMKPIRFDGMQWRTDIGTAL
jgi:phosphoribosylamine--glycine ligase